MNVFQRIPWLWRRLRVMSTAEIVYRLQTGIRDRLVSVGRTAGSGEWPPQGPVHLAAAFFQAEHQRLPVPAYGRNLADEMQFLEGRLPLFRNWLAVQPYRQFWHTDPLFKSVWPQIPYREIDYRPGNAIGDVRVVWELNRLQHLFSLAMIAHHEPAARQVAVRRLETDLQSWHAANPPGIGVHYLSAMEEALRLISLFHAFDLVRRWASPETRGIVAAIAVHHAPHIARRLSLYSSAGNHTIAEATGLLYAGILLPECPGAARWRETGRCLLRIEAARQIDADGGGIEQATWYLLFITDLLGLAQALLAHCGEAPEPAIDAALLRSRCFLNALASDPDDLPRIGDADDGYALSPLLRISWAGSTPARVQRSFRTSGISVVRYGPADRLLFLHNPLGMAPGYGHGHADCLSLVFRHAGVDLLIDPGTGQYGGSPEYRRYFRSAAAHNTVVIDGEDQAEQVAAFMWRRPCRSELLVSRFDSGCSTLLARHDGYRHLGITHWRGVIYQENEFLAIWDLLEGVTDQRAAVHWHLGVRARGSSRRQCVDLEGDSGPGLTMETTGDELVVARGEVQPLLGWRSVAYGDVEPCDVVRIRIPVEPEPVVTVLWLAEPGDIGKLLPLFAEFDTHRLAVSAS